jgi:hypothetical protein
MSLLLLFKSGIRNQDVGGTVTPTGSVAKQPARSLSGVVASSGTALKMLARTLTGSITPAATLIKQLARALVGTVASAGTLVGLKVSFKSLAGSVTPTGIINRLTARSLTGSVTPAGIITRSMTRLVAGVVTPVGDVIKSTRRLLAGGVTPSGTLVTGVVFLRALSGTVASAGTLLKLVAKPLAGTVTPTGVIRRLITRLLSGSLLPIGVASTNIINDAFTTTLIGGVVWPIQYDSLEIEDLLNDEPNQCTFQTRQRPTEGQTISIVRGNTSIVEFYGNILSIEQVSQELPENLLFSVTAQDMTWKFNRRLVTQRWVNISASTIAANIVDNFTTGFTKVNIVGGLAVIPEFICILEKPNAALARLAASIGGNFYIDYGSDVHLFITETSSAPDDLLVTTPFSDFKYGTDLTQIKTRIKAVGGGSKTLIDIAPNSTSMPLETAKPFESAGRVIYFRCRYRCIHREA